MRTSKTVSKEQAFHDRFVSCKVVSSNFEKYWGKPKYVGNFLKMFKKFCGKVGENIEFSIAASLKIPQN